MGWVKDANRKYKAGRYKESRRGFRIYVLIPRNVHVYQYDWPDGYRVERTEFIPGWYIAINKDGLAFYRQSMCDLWDDIEIYHYTGHICLSSKKPNIYE